MNFLKKSLYLLVHLTFWAIPILVFEMVDEERHLGIFSTSQFAFFYPIYYGVALSMAFFYACVYWLMPLLLKKHNVIAAFLGAIAAYVLHSFIEAGIDILVARANPLVSDSASFLHALIANFVINILVFLFAIGYFFLANLIVSERNKVKLREEKLQMELDFLKSQINPHFMFNVLNNLYGTAKKNNDEETANGITQLSGLMRYILDETNEKRVLLKKEIDYLTNYIKLQENRFSTDDDIAISFDVKGPVGNRWIAPMLLISFVENAFMHGISLQQSSFINIKLNTTDNRIIFEVRNSINPLSKAKSGSGLGLKNTKKRLELIYGNNYSLAIVEQPNEFIVKLEINDVV